MGIRNLTRAAIAGAAAVALMSGPVESQGVTYTTSWTFNQGSCTSSQCRFGGYNLQWSSLVPQGGGGFLGGQFTMTCFSSCPYGQVITGSTFLLTITQNGSNTGGGAGTYGSFGWNSNPGPLTWTVTINGVNQNLTGGGDGCTESCNNDPPPSGPTFNDVLPNDVTTTPEPATIGLMATGLIGLIPVVRRRRKNQATA
ncbi:MAG TPA: PEP-CTERM sorting domain-containing protein [Gemmatimonadaceae bacterium]|nr:PEP-CTERM sorting domain-containing protein [Gemmatimonadaceae bacterium]